MTTIRPNAVGRALFTVLFFAPFALGIWLVAAWLIFHTDLSGFLGLFVTGPVAVVEMFALAVIIWLRPSIREARSLDLASAVWFSVSWLLWAVSAVLGNPWGGVGAVVAFIVSAVAIARLSRSSRDENVARMQATFAGSGFGGGAPGAAPRVITIEETGTWEATTPAGGEGGTRGETIIDGEIIDEGDDDEPSGEVWSQRNPPR